MPRVVPVDERRALIADAVWRVVARDGVESASVRRVAQEAELSTGSLRHYFPTQSHLLRFALELVGERLASRLATVGAAQDPVARVAAMIEEMLPLDDSRRLECRVWLAFTARAVVDDALRPAAAEVDRRLEAAFVMMIAALADGGVLREGLHPRLEAERLYALVDGAIVHGLLRGTGATQRWREAVTAHLLEITSAA